MCDLEEHHKQSFIAASYPLFSTSIAGAMLALLLISCSTSKTSVLPDMINPDSVPSRYSLVCIIHGDSDYLYHDTDGNEYDADAEVLTEIKLIAEQNPLAEVFIFHQKAASNFLFFFSQKDGEFYYYRNGNLLAQESYWRDEEQSHLIPETKLYHRFINQNRNEQVSMFMYFGHEIPEFNGAGYDNSYPDRIFTVQDLSAGIKNFKNDSTKFDLMILSTCYGGTPYTIGTLVPYAKTIIASPENLHLSYFDLQPLKNLERTFQKDDVNTFAKYFAQHAFNFLSENVQTAVSVVVYDVDSLKKYLNSVHNEYTRTLTKLKNNTELDSATPEYCDCADLPQYILPAMSDGIKVFYRPARFGRLKNKLTHSGWECRKH